MTEWFYQKEKHLWKEWQNIILPEQMQHWKYENIKIGKLNGNNELELRPDEKAKIIIPINGEGVDVAYTLNGETSTKFLKGKENINPEQADILYLPAGAAVVLRGEAQVAVAEIPLSNHKNVWFISKETIEL